MPIMVKVMIPGPWDYVRRSVREGKAATDYPIGTILYDDFGNENSTAFQVIAHDKHFDPTLTAKGYTHSMTLCELKISDYITLCEKQAFMYTTKLIPAGNYYVYIPTYSGAQGGNMNYYFTAPTDLLPGSQLVLTWNLAANPSRITAYSPTVDKTAMENTTVTDGWGSVYLSRNSISGAINLGTISSATSSSGSSNYGMMNNISRVQEGSNNYFQSCLRQYLNSDKTNMEWWKPQTFFDRPFSDTWYPTGKLASLNEEFLSVLAKPQIESATNQYFETNSIDGTAFKLNTRYSFQDMIFLLAPIEVGFSGWSIPEQNVGTVLDYYVNSTYSTRTKYYKNGTAAAWWTRVPYPFSASRQTYITNSGDNSFMQPNNYSGVAAAVCIQ